MKKIYIKLEDGRLFSIPATIVADDRAKHYEKYDKDTTYMEEFDHAMDDEMDLLDWLYSNMDWYELDPKLEKEAVFPPLNKAVVDETYVKDSNDD